MPVQRAVHVWAPECKDAFLSVDDMRLMPLLTVTAIVSVAAGAARFALPGGATRPWLDVVFLVATAFAVALVLLAMTTRLRRSIGHELDESSGRRDD
ncbi:MAG: hypothetical protein KDA22_12810 [Phycisphaerales bacterium]|nr:hypothetical protein [Phycisphaerales bacterium]